MAKKDNKEVLVTTEDKMLTRISSFFEKYSKAFLVGLVAVVVVIVIGVLISSGISKKNAKRYEVIDALEDRFTVLNAMAVEDEEFAATRDALVADLKDQLGSQDFISAKATYLLGLTYYKSEDYAGAVAAFESAASLDPTSYLAPLALVNAAASRDNLSDQDGALELYRRASEYTESGVVHKALFNIARIQLSKGNTALAKATFQQIVDSAANSEYKAIAKNILTTM